MDLLRRAVVIFGVIPAASGVARWLRSRLGRTTVTVSPQELRVQERGIFRTRTVASWHASEILDIDFSTNESLLLASRRSAEADAATMRNVPSVACSTGVSTDWVFTGLRRLAKGKGIIVKTRTGLTTFGEGLADEEIQYLYAVLRRALTGPAPGG